MRNTQHKMAPQRFARGGSADPGGWPFCARSISPEHTLPLDPAQAQARGPTTWACCWERRIGKKGSPVSSLTRRLCKPVTLGTYLMVSSQELCEGWRVRRGPTRKRLGKKGILWKASSKGGACANSSPCRCWSPTNMLTRACGAVSSHCPGQSRKDQCLSSSMIHLRGQGLEPS